MKIFIGCDHRGFELKEQLKAKLQAESDIVVDCGAPTLDPLDDFVDYVCPVVNQIESEDDRAILICGSGHGMDMAANRFPHVRAIIGFNNDVVVQSRQHENANVLVLPSDWTTTEEAYTRIQLFLSTPFSHGEKYQRRLDKLCQLPCKP